MTRRLQSLRRIETLQARLAQLAESRMAHEERVCRDIAERQTLLGTFIGEEGSLGPRMAKAALRTTKALDDALAKSRTARETAARQAREAIRRRDTVAGMAEREAAAARRAEEDRALAETLEAWLSRDGASLP